MKLVLRFRIWVMAGLFLSFAFAANVNADIRRNMSIPNVSLSYVVQRALNDGQSVDEIVQQMLAIEPSHSFAIVAAVVLRVPERAAEVVSAAIASGVPASDAVTAALTATGGNRVSSVVSAAVRAAPAQVAKIVKAATAAAPDKADRIASAAQSAAFAQNANIQLAQVSEDDVDKMINEAIENPNASLAEMSPSLKNKSESGSKTDPVASPSI